MVASSGPNAAKPTPLDSYQASHPVARAFLTAPKPKPISSATLPFYGVNAFKFTNAGNSVVYGGYEIVPVAGSHFLSDDEAAKTAPNYLGDKIRERVGRAPADASDCGRGRQSC